MHIETLIPMVESQPNEDFIKSLGPDSVDLHRQATRWENLFNNRQSNMIRDLEVISYYETELTPTAERQENGEWKKTGKPTKLVDRFSATAGCPLDDSINSKLPSQPIPGRTHSDLVRFESRNDHVYVTFVLKDLKNLLDTPR